MSRRPYHPYRGGKFPPSQAASNNMSMHSEDAQPNESISSRHSVPTIMSQAPARPRDNGWAWRGKARGSASGGGGRGAGPSARGRGASPSGSERGASIVSRPSTPSRNASQGAQASTSTGMSPPDSVSGDRIMTMTEVWLMQNTLSRSVPSPTGSQSSSSPSRKLKSQSSMSASPKNRARQVSDSPRSKTDLHAPSPTTSASASTNPKDSTPRLPSPPFTPETTPNTRASAPLSTLSEAEKAEKRKASLELIRAEAAKRRRLALEEGIDAAALPLHGIASKQGAVTSALRSTPALPPSPISVRSKDEQYAPAARTSENSVHAAVKDELDTSSQALLHAPPTQTSLSQETQVTIKPDPDAPFPPSFAPYTSAHQSATTSPPARRLVTSGSIRVHPLPADCVKTNANWRRNREKWMSGELTKVRKGKGLRVARVMIREDGLIIDWLSESPVYSDTLLRPTPPSSSPFPPSLSVLPPPTQSQAYPSTIPTSSSQPQAPQAPLASASASSQPQLAHSSSQTPLSSSSSQPRELSFSPPPKHAPHRLHLPRPTSPSSSPGPSSSSPFTLSQSTSSSNPDGSGLSPNLHESQITRKRPTPAELVAAVRAKQALERERAIGKQKEMVPTSSTRLDQPEPGSSSGTSVLDPIVGDFAVAPTSEPAVSSALSATARTIASSVLAVSELASASPETPDLSSPSASSGPPAPAPSSVPLPPLPLGTSTTNPELTKEASHPSAKAARPSCSAAFCDDAMEVENELCATSSHTALRDASSGEGMEVGDLPGSPDPIRENDSHAVIVKRERTDEQLAQPEHTSEADESTSHETVTASSNVEQALTSPNFEPSDAPPEDDPTNIPASPPIPQPIAEHSVGAETIGDLPPEITQLAEDFIRRYVQLFDSDKSALASAYSSNATFSYRTQQPVSPSSNKNPPFAPIDGSRDILGAKSSTTLHISRLAILDTLLSFNDSYKLIADGEPVDMPCDLTYVKMGSALEGETSEVVLMVCYTKLRWCGEPTTDQGKDEVGMEMSFVLKRKEVDEEDRDMDGLWPLLVVAQQVTVREI